MSKSFKAVVVAAIVIAAGSALFVFNRLNAPNQPPTSLSPRPSAVESDAASVPSSPTNPTASWKTLTDAASGFQMKYPVGFFDQGVEPRFITGACNAEVFPGACPNINELVAKDLAADGGDLKVIEENLASPNFWGSSPVRKTVRDRLFCLYATSDAAMSHTYETRYYVTIIDQQCAMAKMTTSATNCSVYLPLEDGNAEQRRSYEACETKNQAQPVLLNQIEETFTVEKGGFPQ